MFTKCGRGQGFLLTVAALVFASYWTLAYSTANPQDTPVIHIDEDQGVDVQVLNLKQFFPELNVVSMTYKILGVKLAHAGSVINDNLLKLDEHSGVLTTNKFLDRDAICESDDFGFARELCQIIVTILARDSGIQSFRKFVIILDDINDNSPNFGENQLTVNIPEGVHPYNFKVPTATDKDIGRNANITFKLKRHRDIFELITSHKIDGSVELKIKLKKKLDYETKKAYQMTLSAWDHGVKPRQDSMYINVQVTNRNDNVPKFKKARYSAGVKENAGVGDFVVKVEARDKDGMSDVVYSISSSVDLPFRIDSRSGKIFVNSGLDYETVPVYLLAVQARDTDSTTPVETMVTITIIDVNDNSPKIRLDSIALDSKVHQAQVMENLKQGTYVALFRVTDNDRGRNGNVTCVLNNWSLRYFYLVSEYAEYYMLYTQKSFDREYKTKYKVTLICSDHGRKPKSSTESFIVNIMDENDNAPYFPQSSYTLKVSESAGKGDHLGRILATDPDKVKQGHAKMPRVKYYLRNADRAVVKVHPTSANITLNVKLDYETTKQYKYILVAEDAVNSSLLTTCRLTVVVLDADDNLPVFSRKHYVFSVYENQPRGTIVGVVNATDLDSPANSGFTYKLVDEVRSRRAEFQVNSNTGLVTTTSRLDRERRANYKLAVETVPAGVVSGSTSPSRITRVPVEIVVLDRNDNAPRFLFPAEGNRTLYVLTSAHAGESIGRLLAVDADDEVTGNGRIRYALRSGSDRFSVDEYTGRVQVKRTARRGDREVQFVLEVTATDGGGRTSHGRMRLLLRGVSSGVAVGGSRRKTGGPPLLDTDFLLVVLAVIVACVLVAVAMTTGMLVFVRKRRRCKQRLSNENEATNSEYAASGSTHTTSGLNASSANHEQQRDVKPVINESQMSPKALPALPHWYSTTSSYHETDLNEVVSPLLHSTLPRNNNPSQQTHFATLQRNNQVYKHEAYT